jgi:hypothetical protein
MDRKSQIPNPKPQIKRLALAGCLLGLGIWGLGSGIFVQAQEGRGGRGNNPLGAVGALGGGGRRHPTAVRSRLRDWVTGPSA